MANPPLISAQLLTKRFGIKPLFEGITFVVNESDRVALLGPNGSGKSTLLRLLAGIDEPDEGSVTARKDLRCSYVAQEDLFQSSDTVGSVIREALLAHRFAENEIERKISIALGEAGFNDSSALVSSLSGGWKKRLSIVRGLAVEPEVLILDEPTNHLDIDGILWLEALLERAPFAALFVSHDRYFIERVSKRVVEINRRFPKGFFTSDGSYSDFLEARDNFLQGLRQSQESLANKVRREVEWLRQGVKARGTKAKFRQDEAARLQKELAGYNLDEKRASLEFSSSDRKTKELIKVEKISKSVGGRALFKDISLILSPGVRLGVVGANGSGKSTFMRVLLSELEPDAGRVVKAKNLKVAFSDQSRQTLDRSLTLKEALCPEGDSVIFGEKSIHVASWAARFLFSTDQLRIPVSELSGGEQARVVLARVMSTPADILLFDEPTNDLDIETLEVLEDALCEFPGAVVLITHDRYLLDRVATTVLGLGEGCTAIYADFSQWISAKKAIRSSERKPSDSQKIDSKPKDRKQSKLTYKEQFELDGIEAKILAAEEAVTETERKMTLEKTKSDPQAFNACCEELSKRIETVESLYKRWDELESKRRSLEEGS